MRQHPSFNIHSRRGIYSASVHSLRQHEPLFSEDHTEERVIVRLLKTKRVRDVGWRKRSTSTVEKDRQWCLMYTKLVLNHRICIFKIYVTQNWFWTIDIYAPLQRTGAFTLYDSSNFFDSIYDDCPLNPSKYFICWPLVSGIFLFAWVSLERENNMHGLFTSFLHHVTSFWMLLYVGTWWMQSFL